ncbi:MAG: hypothetical protein IJR85_04820 [Synergistaceae bacterium]|nr:hypothetical protein [Synergistaceae bacterium]
MESTDREILIELYGKVAAIEAEQARQKQEISSMHTEIGYLREGQVILQHDIANLQTSVYWELAVIGIFLAALAVLPGLRRKPEPEPKPEPSLTPSEVMKMINEGINSRLQSMGK